MNCVNCGGALAVDSIVCPYCGSISSDEFLRVMRGKPVTVAYVGDDGAETSFRFLIGSITHTVEFSDILTDWSGRAHVPVGRRNHLSIEGEVLPLRYED